MKSGSILQVAHVPSVCREDVEIGSQAEMDLGSEHMYASDGPGTLA